MTRLAIAILLACAASAGVAEAQTAEDPQPSPAPQATSRTALIEEQQAAKAQTLTPAAPGKAERYVNDISDILLGDQMRWHTFWQSAYSGGGFTLGAGYMRFVSPYNTLDIRGSITPSGYKRLEAQFLAPGLFGQRGTLSVLGGWREATQVGFYGFGMTSSLDNRANYSFQQPHLSASLEVFPTRRFFLMRGAVELTRWKQNPGSGDVPSVDQIYTPDTLPGLGARPLYWHTQGTIGIDSRPARGYARRGGFYGVTVHDFTDTNSQFGFNQVDYEAIQHIPILRESWVLSFRGWAQTTFDKSGQTIPFFMMPSIRGGSDQRHVEGAIERLQAEGVDRQSSSNGAGGAGAKPLDFRLFYEYAYNLFVEARREPSNTRAGNINTIDEVPDSSWFDNRGGTIAITPEQIARGPNVDAPPAPEKWTVLGEKSAGTNPGFTARDANGQTWFVQFDTPEFPEASTGAVEVMTKLFWALGYNQVQTFVASVDPARIEIDPKATVKRPSGARTPFTRDDVTRVLERAARNPDGTYRASAGRLLSGTILGPFRYSGTRSDDPNDLVPHEHRRELRALRVFGAWTNLVDLKAGNTLDVLVDTNGRAVVKHYLQDVGSSLGMANSAHEWDMGWEYFFEQPTSQRRLLTFGFGLSPWQTVPYEEFPSIGLFEGDRFDPATWKPQTPIPAYVEMRADDAFWAARRVMAFTDELIRAAVHTGQYSDAAAEVHLTSVLIKRRDAVGRAYLTAINPLIDPRLAADGTLTFGNAAVAAGFADAPTAYHAAWLHFDNATSGTTPIAETQSTTTTMRAPANLPGAPGTFIEIDISADSAQHASWKQPIRTYFRRTSDGWKLVGLERIADEPAPTTTKAKDRR